MLIVCYTDADYDLCTNCVSDPERRLGHSLTHVFFPVTTPGDLSLYARAVDLCGRQTGTSGHERGGQLTANISELVSGGAHPQPA